jgi:hypothetical protein
MRNWLIFFSEKILCEQKITFFCDFSSKNMKNWPKRPKKWSNERQVVYYWKGILITFKTSVHSLVKICTLKKLQSIVYEHIFKKFMRGGSMGGSGAQTARNRFSSFLLFFIYMNIGRKLHKNLTYPETKILSYGGSKLKKLQKITFFVFFTTKVHLKRNFKHRFGKSIQKYIK